MTNVYFFVPKLKLINHLSKQSIVHSSISQNSSQTDKLTPSLKNGQRAPPVMAQPPNKKQHPEVLLDCTKPSQQMPSRDRRYVWVRRDVGWG